jgi:RNA polymerase-interacting CarD/CdnL/TRCF family regulator
VGKRKRIRFKVGDRIVEAGRVFRIFKVRYEDGGEKEEQKIIYFKPQFKKNKNALECSIPAKNADDARIRKPVTKKELKEILKTLSKKARKNGKVNTSTLKDKLNKNRAKTTAYVLRKLWVDKHNENTSFSPTKKRIYRKALRNLSEELAWLEKTSVKNARNKIKERLQKAIS